MHARRVLEVVMVLLRRKASRCSPQHAAMAVTRATPCAGSAHGFCFPTLNTTIAIAFLMHGRVKMAPSGVSWGSVSHSVDRKVGAHADRAPRSCAC